MDRMYRASLLLVLGCTTGACGDNGVTPDDTSTGAATTGTTDDSTTGTPTTSTDPTTTTDPSTSSTDPTTTTDPTTGTTTTGDDTTGTTTTGDDTTGTTDASSTGDTDSSSGSSSSGDTPGDGDSDGIPDADDNCPEVANPQQDDSDDDAFGDACDSCVDVPDPDQGDQDADGIGDLCDEEVVDNADLLLVPAGASLELGGEHCYAQVVILGTVTVPAFADSDTTGKLTLKADTILVGPDGLITADEAGFAGGNKSPANGGLEGAGPGRGCGGGPGSCVGQGGTGASYGGLGAGPNNNWSEGNACDTCSQATVGHCEGAPGPVQGTLDGDDITLGSGGGAAGNSCGCNNAGGVGGRGGGAISLLANDWVQVQGTISAVGEEPAPDDSACGYRAGGGGGSGGGIIIAADAVIGPVGATLRATGGRGGEALGQAPDQSWGWAGGGGGGGRVKVFAPDNQWTGTIDVAGGLGGEFPATQNSFGADPGAAGSSLVLDKLPAVFDNIVCN